MELTYCVKAVFKDLKILKNKNSTFRKSAKFCICNSKKVSF